MPIAPKLQPKIVRQPVQGFKAATKKAWDLPSKNSFTVEDLAKELSIVSSNLLLIAATIAEPLDADDPKEGEKLHKASQDLRTSAEHLSSVYCRLMSYGMISRQQDTMTVFRADDIPW